MTQTQQVSFLSDDVQIAATLYLPNESQKDKSPGIILCHGFACVKEMLLPAYAKKFAEAGYIVLTFDYRGFGASSGEPGRLVPKLQIEDIQNAINFLASCEQVDANRIGLWGTSYGGGNAIVAASKDKRIKCLCVQLAFGDGKRCITGNMSPEDAATLISTFNKLKEKKESTGKEMMVPVRKILSDEQSKAFIEANIEKFPALKIKIPFLTVWETLNYKPESYLPDLQAPILIIGAENDIVNPLAESHSLYKLAKEPKELMVVKGATHFEVYEGEYFNQVVNKEIAWFRKWL